MACRIRTQPGGCQLTALRGTLGVSLAHFGRTADNASVNTSRPISSKPVGVISLITRVICLRVRRSRRSGHSRAFPVLRDGGPNPCRATRPLQPNFCRRETAAMLTVVLGRAQDFPCCSFSTSPEHSITGILRSPMPLHLGERSFCSKAQASGVLLARCLTRSTAWRSMHWLSWTGLVSKPAMFSVSHLVAWSRSRWRRTAPLFFGG